MIPLLAVAAGVSVKFDPSSAATMPFPSDPFTVRDWTQNTFRRVNLPKPICAASPAAAAECADIDVINELDGFSSQPRITIPFTGDIDPGSVNSDTVYLRNLGDPLSLHGSGQRVGLNQVLWDPTTKTLVVQPDKLLRQHSRYLLVVTNGVRDAKGTRIEGGRFGRREHERSSDEYDRDMRDGLRGGHGRRHGVVAASVFTTQSITADLAKISRQIKATAPGPVNFNIGLGAAGATRAVFSVADLQGIRWHRWRRCSPPKASRRRRSTSSVTVAERSARWTFSVSEPRRWWCQRAREASIRTATAPSTPPKVPAQPAPATPNVPGGSITEIARLSPVFRPLTALALLPRGLLNLPPAAAPAFPLQFNENIPLRDAPTLINTVTGAMAVQQALDRFQWVQQAGNPVSYARHIHKQPLHGNSAKPVLIQFAKGDLTMPNPTSSAIIRAGDLADRTVLFRNDLAFAANPTGVPRNPHTFLSNIGAASTVGYAVGAQMQIATFFASGGTTVIDPDGAAGPFFEVPIALPLPEGLNFLP